MPPPLDPQLATRFAAVLDTLLPAHPNGGVAAAGSLGIGPEVWERCGPSGWADGLAALDAFSRAQTGQAFADLPGAEREAVLRGFDAADPGALGGLVFHTYAVYYQEPRVMEALGLEGRAPFPKGYALETGDLSGLEAVRARGPRYREI
ncbi:MAG: gluconate 2-dehydrogenase subunit 3 family protein [Myxococcota bacterium]